MLTMPHAVSLTGLRAGLPLIVAYTLISMWTVHLLNALYLEYKRSKVSIPSLPLMDMPSTTI
jgi:amino acid permease